MNANDHALPQQAKGSTIHSSIAFLESAYDEALVQRVRGRLQRDVADAVVHASATDEVPYAHLVALWQAAASEIDALDADARGEWAERAGAAAIASLGMRLYGGILRKPTPREFLTQSVSLFRLFYHPGDMEVVEDLPGRAVLRLVGFDPMTRIFCQRQTGGLREAITVAGGEGARVRHVRCCLDGDAFCEWELHWTPNEAVKG